MKACKTVLYSLLVDCIALMTPTGHLRTRNNWEYSSQFIYLLSQLDLEFSSCSSPVLHTALTLIVISPATFEPPQVRDLQQQSINLLVIGLDFHNQSIQIENF